jgi:hypothetical protein
MASDGSVQAALHVKYRVPLTPRTFSFTLSPSSLDKPRTGDRGGAD